MPRGWSIASTPSFLEDQLNRSLERLGLEAVDAFLLHNPEYYMVWAESQGIDQADARQEFDARLARAFAYLEKLVAEGRIGCYGISSNTLVSPASAYDFVSLSRVWELAVKANPSGHALKVVQFPFNLWKPRPPPWPISRMAKRFWGLPARNALGCLATAR